MTANSEGLLDLMRMKMDHDHGSGLVGGKGTKFKETFADLSAADIFEPKLPQKARQLIETFANLDAKSRVLKKKYADIYIEADEEDRKKLENYRKFVEKKLGKQLGEQDSALRDVINKLSEIQSGTYRSSKPNLRKSKYMALSELDPKGLKALSESKEY